MALIPPPTPIISHQPLESQNYVIFTISAQILNGISVSGPPIFGERPYPSQFHPVESDPFFVDFLMISPSPPTDTTQLTH